MAASLSFLTRRQTLALPLVVAASPLLAAAPRGDFAARLQAALAEVLSGPIPAELSVLRFETGPRSFSAVIHLSWPPGMRRRHFAAEDMNPEAAFSALLTEIQTYFGELV